MVDLSQLLGLSGKDGNDDPTGLLTPQQTGNVNQSMMQGIAAGLLKASGPSPYKPGMTALSGLGEALQGGLAARRQAQEDALKQTLVRAKTLEGMAPYMKLMQEAQEAGTPLSPQMQNIINTLGNVTGVNRGGAPGTFPAAGGGMGTPAASGGNTPAGLTPTQAQMWGAIPDVPTPAGASPPTNLRQKFADWQGFSRRSTIAGASGASDFDAAFNDWFKASSPTLKQSERDKAVQASDIARSEKAYPALVGLGHAAYQAKQDTELSQALVNEPGFKSGFGSGLSELAKKFIVSIGGDPNAAFPMEAFNKITASNINTQIGEMKGTAAEMGGAAGRVFQSQINLMEKASQNLANTPAANRFLANLQARAADLNIAISDMAIQYKKEHGILDAGFDEKMSKHLRDNPLYSKDELANLPKIATPPGSPGAPAPQMAAPTAPPGAVERRVSPDGKQVMYFDAQGKPILPQAAAIPQAGQ